MSRRKSNSFFSAPAFFATLRGSIRFLLVGMAVLVLLYLGSGITIVNHNEVGLVVRLGAVQKWVYPPGLLIAFPAPID